MRSAVAVLSLILLISGDAALGWPAGAAAQTFHEFPIPTPGSSPQGIALGPDGSLWFAENNTIDGVVGKIGRITTAGVITEFTCPWAGCDPFGITAGPDTLPGGLFIETLDPLKRALWFTDQNYSQQTNKIGRVTAAGVFTEFTVPTPNSLPRGITRGPDGALWFTEQNANNVGRITTAGVITEFPTSSSTSWITAAHGALWFTESAGKIGRITTKGVITEFVIPTPNSGPQQITEGPDGALWFTEQSANKIGRITTAGAFTEFPIPTANSSSWWITHGPDGALWFTEFVANKIGRVTHQGVFTEFTIPTANSGPAGIAIGPGGAIWFVEQYGQKIGRLQVH